MLSMDNLDALLYTCITWLLVCCRFGVNDFLESSFLITNAYNKESCYTTDNSNNRYYTQVIVMVNIVSVL